MMITLSECEAARAMLGLLCDPAEFATAAFPAWESDADLPSWACAAPLSEPIAPMDTQNAIDNAMRRKVRDAIVAKADTLPLAKSEL